jgi:hypothetical protein
VLIEELGSEPWPELRRLQRQILAADPELRLSGPAPGGPPMVGRGSCRPQWRTSPAGQMSSRR